MKKRNYKCIIKVIAILILMIVAGVFITNIYDIKFGKKGEGINMGGPKCVGENYFTWLNNYGFFPKVTEIEIEYVFDNVKSVENLEVQVGVVRR